MVYERKTIQKLELTGNLTKIYGRGDYGEIYFLYATMIHLWSKWSMVRPQRDQKKLKSGEGINEETGFQLLY